MRKVALIVASVGLAASAQAATITFQYGLPPVESTADINQSGTLGLFNPALGTPTSAVLSYTSAGTSTITLTYTGVQSTNAAAIKTIDFTWDSTLAALNALLPDTQVSFATSSDSYTAGQSRTFGPTSGTAFTNVNLASILGSLSGVGTFPIRCETLTSTTVIGGGGNISVSGNTSAGCGASITYTYTPGVVGSVPEPASLALAGLGLVGIVAASCRRPAHRPT